MDEPPQDREIVFRSRHRDECMESRLVLQAAGISTETRHHDGRWLLVVSRKDWDAATAELQAYRQDNSEDSISDRTRVPLFGGALSGVFVYSASIILFAVLSERSAFGWEWLSIGRMRAGDVMPENWMPNGLMTAQWWRTVTALTLHVDALHLLSNLVFGCVFGLLAGRILGGGVAWLTIVIAGAMGNLMNAIVRDADHSSIGASTAVFAALGIMVAHALRPRSPIRQSMMKRWSPLIGGVLILAFIGVGGERTDVVAHVTGFLAGLLIGWLGCRLPERLLASRSVQVGAGVATVAIVITSWVMAVISAG